VQVALILMLVFGAIAWRAMQRCDELGGELERERGAIRDGATG
jgi:hypothetical protein